MSYLLDTHVLLWAAQDSPKLSAKARRLLSDDSVELAFSVVSIWEILIKSALARPDMDVDAAGLRAASMRAGMAELPVRGPHVLAVTELSRLHQDPFDRLLLAQARYEGLTLLTVDKNLLRYRASVQRL